MSYQKQIWENLPSTNTPVNAERLNHMEDGIEAGNASSVEDTYSTSTTDSYSCNYINSLLATEGTGYIKFKDGTMICYGEKSFSNISTLGYGSGLYRSVSILFDDFAQEFISAPITTYSLKELSPNSNGSMLNVLTMASATGAGRVCVVKEENSAVTGVASYIAIGKWK